MTQRERDLIEAPLDYPEFEADERCSRCFAHTRLYRGLCLTCRLIRKERSAPRGARRR